MPFRARVGLFCSFLLLVFFPSFQSFLRRPVFLLFLLDMRTSLRGYRRRCVWCGSPGVRSGRLSLPNIPLIPFFLTNYSLWRSLRPSLVRRRPSVMTFFSNGKVGLRFVLSAFMFPINRTFFPPPCLRRPLFFNGQVFSSKCSLPLGASRNLSFS